MDILLSKYGLIFPEFESIDLGSASVDTVKFSKYQTIFTEYKVHNCIIFYDSSLLSFDIDTGRYLTK